MSQARVRESGCKIWDFACHGLAFGIAYLEGLCHDIQYRSHGVTILQVCGATNPWVHIDSHAYSSGYGPPWTISETECAHRRNVAQTFTTIFHLECETCISVRGSLLVYESHIQPTSALFVLRSLSSCRWLQAAPYPPLLLLALRFLTLLVHNPYPWGAQEYLQCLFLVRNIPRSSFQTSILEYKYVVQENERGRPRILFSGPGHSRYVLTDFTTGAYICTGV